MRVLNLYNLFCIFFLSFNIVLIGSESCENHSDSLPVSFSDDRGTFVYNPDIFAYVLVPGSKPELSSPERLKRWWKKRFVQVVYGSPIANEPSAGQSPCAATTSYHSSLQCDLVDSATADQGVLSLPEKLSSDSTGLTRAVRASMLSMPSVNSDSSLNRTSSPQGCVCAHSIPLQGSLVVPVPTPPLRTVSNVRFIMDDDDL